jgi:hypothetical protein
MGEELARNPHFRQLFDSFAAGLRGYNLSAAPEHIAAAIAMMAQQSNVAAPSNATDNSSSTQVRAGLLLRLQPYPCGLSRLGYACLIPPCSASAAACHVRASSKSKSLCHVHCNMSAGTVCPRSQAWTSTQHPEHGEAPCQENNGSRALKWHRDRQRCGRHD